MCFRVKINNFFLIAFSGGNIFEEHFKIKQRYD